jgi:hypothetical protein
MALEADKPPLIAALTGQASAPPRDVDAAKLATITAVRTGRSVSDAEKTAVMARSSSLSVSAGSYVPLGGRHQAYFFGLRCLHDCVRLIQADSPIPIYPRVQAQTAWADTSTKDTVRFATAIHDATLNGSGSRNRLKAMPLVRESSTPERQKSALPAEEEPASLLPARPKGTAQRINRRIQLLQAEIQLLSKFQEDRVARHTFEAHHLRPRGSPRPGPTRPKVASGLEDDKKKQAAHQWMTPQVPVSLSRERNTPPVGGDATTPQRPTMTVPQRRCSITQSHVLEGGLGEAVVSRAAGSLQPKMKS